MEELSLLTGREPLANIPPVQDRFQQRSLGYLYRTVCPSEYPFPKAVHQNGQSRNGRPDSPVEIARRPKIQSHRTPSGIQRWLLYTRLAPWQSAGCSTALPYPPIMSRLSPVQPMMV
jgi:hypothetical protein